MASIYIVNHSISGPYAQCYSSFHHTPEDAATAFAECKQSVGDDPALIELIALDTDTLEAVTHCGWEGNIDDLEDEERGYDEDGLPPEGYAGEDEYEDNGIVEGVPGE